jgi:hypothetical protein
MRKAWVWCVALQACLCAGCSTGPDAPPKPPEKNVFDPLVQQEQRARDVQKTIDENAERERKAAAAQERGDPAP